MGKSVKKTAKKPVKKVVKGKKVVKAKKVVKTAKKSVKKAAKKPVKKASTAACVNKISKNMRCGAKHNNTICPFGYCSKWGWCGMSSLHKSTHQPAYDHSACKANKRRVLDLLDYQMAKF